ncbi:MAG TPA: hypothetical protein G4O07_00150 [Dehalococcoidia bacterium]|nr:hypothetical protein [Dehalococcoidia bacterium]
MEMEERVRALEDEFRTTADEIKQILLDIRTFLMEADSPLRAQSDNEKSRTPDGTERW